MGDLIRSLNLPSPTDRATDVAQPPRHYRPNSTDRYALYRIGDVTLDGISAALTQAAQGFIPPLADLEDLALTHSVLRGIFEQRVAGLSQVPREVVAGGASPIAARMAEEFRADLEKGSAAFREFERAYLRLRLRGGGLIEPVWGFRDGGWHIVEFVPVPRQRIRFDRETGELAFAASRWSFEARPVSSFAPGTWVVITPDAAIPDFAKRGELRSCLPDWYGVINVSGTYLQYIERCGTPLVDIASDDPKERESAQEIIANFGASGGISHKFTNSAVKFQDGARAAGASGSVHREYEDSRRRNWSIALLGADQTVAVSNGDGSQQSAGVHADVRLDKIQGDAKDFMADVDRYVAVQWAIRNYGPNAAAEAPHLVYQFMDEVDEANVIANIKAAEEIGVEVGEDDAYARLRWQKPAPGTRTLRQAREEARAAAGDDSPSNVVPMPAGGKR